MVFDGQGGSSEKGAVDDKTPNAYEEAWDVIDTNGATTGGTPTVINGGGGDNMFVYSTPSMGGAVAQVSYQNHGGADANESYTDFAITVTPEAVEGLTLGFANADNTIGPNRDQDETTMYATYAVGALTVGVQSSELDDTTAGSDLESIGYGVTYAVNDDFSIGYSSHTVEFDNAASDNTDQDSTGISFSYTTVSYTHLTLPTNREV